MPETAAIEALAVHGLTTVQDLGRPGRMHEGVPPGGALVPELAVRANRLAGNEDGAALLEVFGDLRFAVRGSPVFVACDDGTIRTLMAGESFDVATGKGLRVRYVAFGGGLAVPEVLGGRGTLQVAALGGHEGRGLRRGDRIPLDQARVEARDTSGDPPHASDFSRSVRVLPGPDAERFEESALACLLGGPFTLLSTSDRTGARLDGPSIPRRDADTGRSSPMTLGAIQVPRSGAPIVLGPDHPTTGGYPVIGVVVRADVGLLFARPAGTTVRFTAATASLSPSPSHALDRR